MAAKIAAYKASLTEEQKALHRQSFIHFAKCLAGNSPEIFAATVDGKQYKGVYNTMTPFPGEDFRVCVRSSMAVVSTWFIMVLLETSAASPASSYASLGLPSTGSFYLLLHLALTYCTSFSVSLVKSCSLSSLAHLIPLNRTRICRRSMILTSRLGPLLFYKARIGRT